MNYIKCPHCEKKIDLEHKISTKATKHSVLKQRRCKECSEHGHGCFGSQKKNGYGYTHCADWVEE